MSTADNDQILTSLAREILMLDEQDQSLIPGYLDEINKLFVSGQAVPKNEKILIIGAGIAGLVAGAMLKKAGYQIQILEANDDRIGGRVKTLSPELNARLGKPAPFSNPNQYAEAGAMRIPQEDIHPLVHSFINNFKLNKRLFYNVDVSKANDQDKTFNTWYRTNCEADGANQIRKHDYQQSNAPSLGFPTGAFEGRTASSLLTEALSGPNSKVDRSLPINDQINGWKEIIQDYGDVNMRQYLKTYFIEAYQHASDDDIEGALDAIGTLENLTSRMSYSFIQSFIETGIINSETVFWELEGGSWTLPYAFLDQELLEETDIFYDNRVIEIGWQKSDNLAHPKASHKGTPGVYVRTINEAADKRGENRSTHTNLTREFTADRLIVTVPFSALRHIEISPLLCYQKRRAIQELHYDSATKVLLEFSERFWEWDQPTWESKLAGEYRGHNSLGGGSVTDNPNRFIYFPSHKVSGSSGGVVLSSYTWADDARRWDSIPDSDRYAFALKGVCELYGDEIKQYFTGVGRTESWMQNFYAFGEAAIFYPGQLRYLHPYIPKSEGQLHFAGEHTSLKHAWIEGAIESAIRVTLEIRDNANIGACQHV